MNGFETGELTVIGGDEGEVTVFDDGAGEYFEEADRCGVGWTVFWVCDCDELTCAMFCARNDIVDMFVE